jgi:hypothetical protein
MLSAAPLLAMAPVAGSEFWKPLIFAPNATMRA